MLTVMIIVLAALAVCGAGEGVRSQLRRMLAHPHTGAAEIAPASPAIALAGERAA